jgi:hypothetical protein
MGHVGLTWASTFVTRQEELEVKLNLKHDQKRALCEDPRVIHGWFGLVANIKAKYGIQDDDTYNFDEACFMIGQITNGSVGTAQGRPKQIQPRNRERATVIQGINYKGWAIPPFIIFKARYHLSNWYKGKDLPQDWVIGIFENGWTTNQLSFDWLKHFDAHRMLVVDGHESHNSVEFQQYCKDNNIVPVCVPRHSSPAAT